jgi:protein required for attachment to host cells
LLGAARKAGRFTDLVLVAEPRFLGYLREELDRPTRRFVRQELTRLGVRPPKARRARPQ